jgi:hypothetical protein
MTTTTTERLVLTFDDGCDADTVSTILREGWIARLTLDLNYGAQGTCDVEVQGGCAVDNELGVTFRHWTEEDGPTGEPFDVGLSHIVELHIY